MSRDPRPRYQQIAADLRAAILGGVLRPGEALPSVRGLMDQHDVSTSTMQAALKLLKDEGYLVGEQGRGVFVRPQPQQTIAPEEYVNPSPPGEPYVWMVEAARRGQVGTSRLLSVDVDVRPAGPFATALGLTDGETAVVRTQILGFDSDPVELVRTFYPMTLAAGTPLVEQRKIRGGAPTVLAGLGLLPAETVDTILTRPPTTEEYVQLELPAEVPVLRTFRVTYAAGRRPIEVTESVKAGHRYELRYRILTADVPVVSPSGE